VSKPDKSLIEGPAGRIELAFDWPDGNPSGLAFIGHPHPLYGGTMDNKVVTTIARSFAALGWLAVRLNFRGVGASEGTHAEGSGETDDMLHVVEAAPKLPELERIWTADLPLALAGFSFGSFVAACAAHSLQSSDRPLRHLILVGAAAGKWPMPAVRQDTLVIHGELDETIPLADVFDWARPQELAIVVVPGADHFFHRRLTHLKRLISAHIRGMSSFDAAPQSH
jgi:uncharacterized protein